MPAMSNPPFMAMDASRRVIRVFGDEDRLPAVACDRECRGAGAGRLRAGRLATPQGRILADMMILRRQEGFLIDCDESRAADLFTRLRRYRLRRPIDLALETEMRVWVGWEGGMPDGAAIDPRHPSLGWRWISPDGAHPPGVAEDAIRPIALWHARRIAAGVPQGPVDLVPERADAGGWTDRLGAVDFSKGCYVGQEVTARTHYRGLVKRRIVPLRIDAGAVPEDAQVTEGQTAIGTVLSQAADGAQMLCLAAMKLSDLHRLLNDGGTILVDEHPAHLALPDWMLHCPIRRARTKRNCDYPGSLKGPPLPR